MTSLGCQWRRPALLSDHFDRLGMEIDGIMNDFSGTKQAEVSACSTSGELQPRRSDAHLLAGQHRRKQAKGGLGDGGLLADTVGPALDHQ